MAKDDYLPLVILKILELMLSPMVKPSNSAPEEDSSLWSLPMTN